MNKHAWLIIAHNEIEVTKRLVSLLDDNRNDIFIHVDKKFFNSNWNKLTECVTISKIKILSKINVKWGGILRLPQNWSYIRKQQIQKSTIAITI